ncbi:uncharacterized protein LOC130495816 [Raphanus sativus]|uniref:Uncharacterized protein LOC130495816 n=1 Tax=Raphanus sativus TaxID=3726 RepID=A0A9W3BVF4_RAPSA|nr:uncharacterized protein LOC130495816 [Raphanus sativus]
METPTPKVIKGLVKFHLGVMISYSTALHGKNLAVCERRGSPQDIYKMMHCYLHMVEQYVEYVEEHIEKGKWARVFVPRHRYNLDTSNSVKSMNNVFKEAWRCALIPMLDCIIRTFSDWFNQHRKDVASGSVETKLVPLVENYLHDLWAVARTLPVRELNSYELEYEITSNDGNMYLASLVTKSCSCKVWDYEKFPCLHGLAAYIYYTKDVDGGVGRRRDIQIVYHELCSRYYWAEMWALAYSRTLYVVSDRSSWNLPDHIKEFQIIPPD